ARDRLLVALGHVLHVRRSELERTLRMTGLAVVLGCAMYTAFNGTQAIFLDRAGPPAYPLFFVVLALSVWPAIALQSFAIRRLGRGRGGQRPDRLSGRASPLPAAGGGRGGRAARRRPRGPPAAGSPALDHGVARLPPGEPAGPRPGPPRHRVAGRDAGLRLP